MNITLYKTKSANNVINKKLISEKNLGNNCILADNTSVTASASFTTDFYHYLTRAVLDSNYPIVAFILD